MLINQQGHSFRDEQESPWGAFMNAKGWWRREKKVSTLSNFFPLQKWKVVKNDCFTQYYLFLFQAWSMNMYCNGFRSSFLPSHPSFLKKKNFVCVFIGAFMLHKC